MEKVINGSNKTNIYFYQIFICEIIIFTKIFESFVKKLIWKEFVTAIIKNIYFVIHLFSIHQNRLKNVCFVSFFFGFCFVYDSEGLILLSVDVVILQNDKDIPELSK